MDGYRDAEAWVTMADELAGRRRASAQGRQQV